MTIKVITVNIWNGKFLDTTLTPFLRQENADLLFFQEIYHGHDEAYPSNFRSFTVIKKALNMPHAVFGPQFKAIYDGVSADRGNAIFSKFPLEFVGNYFFGTSYITRENEMSLGDWRDSPRNLLHATAFVNGSAVDVFCIHGEWDFHGNDSPARDHMGKVILDKIHDREHVILAGDFNMFPHTACIDSIEEKLTNVFKDELKTTFNVKHKVDPAAFAQSVVDMMFVSPKIKVVTHYVPDVDVSDHMPLVAQLEIN